MFKWNNSFFELERIEMQYNHLSNLYQRSLPIDYGLMDTSFISATLKMYQPPFFNQVQTPVLAPSYLSSIEASLPIVRTYWPFTEKYFPIVNVPNQFINTLNRPEINRIVQASEAVANLIPKSMSQSVFQSPAFMGIQNISNRLSPLLESYRRIASLESFQNQEVTIDIGNDRANEIFDLLASSVPDTVEEKSDILQSLSNRMKPAAILALVYLLLESANLVLTVSGINCPQLDGIKETLEWLIAALEFYCACNKKSPDVKEIDDGTGRFNQERKG